MVEVRMTGFLVVLVLLILLVVGAVLYGIGGYNSLVRMRNLVEESWRQVDVELNRRYDLIPNLVETVKGYAAHESGTLEEVVRLRNQAAGMATGSPSEQRAGVEEQLTGAIRQLLVTVEAYPDLKANTNFVELQRQLADTEDRIANGRRYYNANVRNYNTRIESFPTNIIAGFGKFERATYFEVNDAAVRQAPKVSFGSTPAAPSVGAAFETPNFSARAGTQDALPPVPEPTQSGQAFGYQAPQVEPVPATPPTVPQQAPGYGTAVPPYPPQNAPGYTPPQS
jgi:LemA protein